MLPALVLCNYLSLSGAQASAELLWFRAILSVDSAHDFVNALVCHQYAASHTLQPGSSVAMNHDTLTSWVCLQVFEQMQAANLRPETACYAAMIDLLWMSGIVGAQQRAQQLFQLACRQSVRGMQAAQEQQEGSQLEVTLHCDSSV